jgi:hypothetical protein
MLTFSLFYWYALPKSGSDLRLDSNLQISLCTRLGTTTGIGREFNLPQFVLTPPRASPCGVAQMVIEVGIAFGNTARNHGRKLKKSSAQMRILRKSEEGYFKR